MTGFESIRHLLGRLSAYNPWEVLAELAIIWALVYIVWRFIQGTRAAGALRGILVLVLAILALRLFTPPNALERLSFLFDNILGFAVIAIVIIFQPELRRAMTRLGETPILRQSTADYASVIDAIVASGAFLSKNKFGAILAIERRVGLRELIESGKRLNADVTPELLQSIFWPNNPLHDMGVVIRGKRIVAAGVQFPLADPAEVSDPRIGTRHRAAVGLSRVSDALVVVISEESGAISLAERGRLERWLTPESLKAELTKRLEAEPPEPDDEDEDEPHEAAEREEAA